MGIFLDSINDARFATVEPRKSDKVQTTHQKNSPLINRLTLCVEDWQVYPAKICR